MQIIQSIQNRIYEIRGERIMLDRDLAALYEVETRIFNQAVKRNLKRFPKDFMFQLTLQEWEELRLNIIPQSMSSQIVMTYPDKRPLKALPYVFTEQGVAMLSGILNSDRAIKMPARLTPVGRECCYYAGFCRGKKSTIATNRY